MGIIHNVFNEDATVYAWTFLIETIATIFPVLDPYTSQYLCLDPDEK